VHVRAYLFTGLVLAAFAMFPGQLAAQGDDADAIVGQWVTACKKGRIEIAKENGKYYGALIWTSEPVYPADDKEAGKPKRDRHNPDPAKRHRPLIGVRILNNLEHTGGNRWAKGVIYNSETGKTYQCRLTLVDKNRLKVRGFVGCSLLGGSTVWTRYEAPEPKPEAPVEPDQRAPCRSKEGDPGG